MIRLSVGIKCLDANLQLVYFIKHSEINSECLRCISQFYLNVQTWLFTNMGCCWSIENVLLFTYSTFNVIPKLCFNSCWNTKRDVYTAHSTHWLVWTVIFNVQSEHASKTIRDHTGPSWKSIPVEDRNEYYKLSRNKCKRNDLDSIRAVRMCRLQWVV